LCWGDSDAASTVHPFKWNSDLQLLSLLTLLLQMLSFLPLLSLPVDFIALCSCLPAAALLIIAYSLPVDFGKLLEFFFAVAEPWAATTSTVACCHRAEWFLTLHSILFHSCRRRHLSLLCIATAALLFFSPPVDCFLFPCCRCQFIVNLWNVFASLLQSSHCARSLLLLHCLLLLLCHWLLDFCCCWSLSSHHLHCCRVTITANRMLILNNS